MKKLTVYELENDYNYDCDDRTRKGHITTLIYGCDTRLEQEEYMELMEIELK